MGPYKPLLLGGVSHSLLHGNVMGVDRPDRTNALLISRASVYVPHSGFQSQMKV